MKRQDGSTPGNVPAGDGFSPIDRYIGGFPPPIQARLQTLRSIIAREAPEAQEIISYRMPAFRLGETLVYFAAFARHIGFYPTSGPIAAFREELKPYKASKGAVQFPLDRELPEDLIARMTRFRVGEVLDKAAARKKPESSVRSPPAGQAGKSSAKGIRE